MNAEELKIQLREQLEQWMADQVHDVEGPDGELGEHASITFEVSRSTAEDDDDTPLWDLLLTVERRKNASE